MDWQEKLAALQEFSDCSLRMRNPGNWYVSQSCEIKESPDACVLIGAYGNGECPEAAVEDHWRKLAEELPNEAVIVISAMNQSKRRHLRWVGHMWKDVP